MVETHASVTSWQRATFEAPTVRSAMRKLEEELSELRLVVTEYERIHTDPQASIYALRDMIGTECADVCIILHRVCDALGVDLDVAVDAKMAVNRRRTWDKKAEHHV